MVNFRIKFNLQNGKKVYEIPEDICHNLFQRAEEILVNCYPDNADGFAVALLTENGKIYEGVSYVSDTYTLTMHAEATALAHAAIHGDTNIIAITGPNCHMCKQLLWENSLRSGIDIVVLIEEDGVINQIPISELMPYPWPEKEE